MISFREAQFSQLKYLQISPIGKLWKLVEKAVEDQATEENEKLQQTMAENPDYPWEVEVREMVLGELWQVRDLASKFLLLSLYQHFETALARCIDEIYRPRGYVSEVHEKARVKDEASRYRSVLERLGNVLPDYKVQAGFNEISELRLLVNSWKHDGFVTKTLSDTFPRWKRCQPLDITEEDFTRLRDGVVRFCQDVGTRLHDHWRKLDVYSKNAEKGLLP